MRDHSCFGDFEWTILIEGYKELVICFSVVLLLALLFLLFRFIIPIIAHDNQVASIVLF